MLTILPPLFQTEPDAARAYVEAMTARPPLMELLSRHAAAACLGTAEECGRTWDDFRRAAVETLPAARPAA